MIIAYTVPIPHRRKSRAHGREARIDRFDIRRVILEMDTVLTTRSGPIDLYRFKNVHVSVRYNVSPIMPEHNYRQDISQNDVYNNPCRERDKRLDPGIGQFPEPRGKPDT